jgi:hypothetical protein
MCMEESGFVLCNGADCCSVQINQDSFAMFCLPIDCYDVDCVWPDIE